jgi:Flp pilus assembly protein TadG
MKQLSLQQKNMNKERAQSLVELAISLIVILLLLLGAVEFSIALFQYVTIRDAAQEGALYGSIYPPNPPNTVAGEADIRDRAIDAASDVVLLTADDIDLDYGASCEGSTNGAPNTITVTINFAHPVSFPLIGPAIGSNTINLRASVTNTILSPTCLPPPSS